MNHDAGFTRCLSFINCQLNPQGAHPYPGQTRRGVTISRQTGSGGHAVAEELTKLLRQQWPGEKGENCEWVIFDRNLVERVLEDHHLPTRLAKFMPEDRITGLTDTMDELFGLHPPSFTLVRQVADTIYRLAEMGNVILIGRGAHVITARLKHMFHVRLVGSLEKRAANLQKTQGMDRAAALQTIRREDLGRKRYLHKYLGADIDNPLLYHLVINTDHIAPATAAKLIVEAMSHLPVNERSPMRELASVRPEQD